LTEAWPLPESLVAHLRAYAGEPAVPRRAATVMLLRDDPLRVYLVRRAPTMAFAAGMHAFPGGVVDPRDAQVPVQFAGRGPDWWAARLGVDAATAQAVVCAAVREVFEESGVLLAGPGEVRTAGEEWEAARLALVSRELAFADLLAARGLALRADLLGPWARWLTPEFEPRRYDTHFFAAALPPGQAPRHVGGEADRVAWLPPADAGDLPMLPPTRLTLRQLGAYPTVAEVLAASEARDAATVVMPRLVIDGTGARLVVDVS